MNARALVREYEWYAPAGIVGEALAARGLDVVVSDVDEQPDPVGFDLVVPLGSVASVRDAATTPWISRELELLRRADAARVPVLGICFGGQLLASALGGQVVAASVPELGWLAIDTDDPQRLPVGPWVQWHYDAIEPPPGATVLARTATGVQAFAVGRHLGLQFHPEVDERIMDLWIEQGGDELRARGVDLDRLRSETRERVPRARQLAGQLVDAFLRSARVAARPVP